MSKFYKYKNKYYSRYYNAGEQDGGDLDDLLIAVSNEESNFRIIPNGCLYLLDDEYVGDDNNNTTEEIIEELIGNNIGITLEEIEEDDK